MFTHVMVGTNDLEKSKKFYSATLAALGYGEAVSDREDRFFFPTDNGAFGVTKPIDGKPATVANGGTIGFAAKSIEEADAWHKAGVENGGTSCENPPGIRESETRKMYLAYLRDPDGNKLCVMVPLEK